MEKLTYYKECSCVLTPVLIAYWVKQVTHMAIDYCRSPGLNLSQALYCLSSLSFPLIS